MNQQTLQRIFGVSFLHGPYDMAMQRLNRGALMVVPSGPGLATVETDSEYLQAIQGADFAIPDSGLMVLLCRCFGIGRLTKLSGLEFLRCFFDDDRLDGKKILLVNPNLTEDEANRQFIANLRHQTIVECYTAPYYPAGVLEDAELVARINTFEPDYVLLNIGGGVQERLGYFLKTHVDKLPGIICTGAAIAFLTGFQARIPDWADRFYLGWLYRCMANPRIFVPRYLAAFKLVAVVVRYRLHSFPESQL